MNALVATFVGAATIVNQAYRDILTISRNVVLLARIRGQQLVTGVQIVSARAGASGGPILQGLLDVWISMHTDAFRTGVSLVRMGGTSLILSMFYESLIHEYLKGKQLTLFQGKIPKAVSRDFWIPYRFYIQAENISQFIVESVKAVIPKPISWIPDRTGMELPVVHNWKWECYSKCKEYSMRGCRNVVLLASKPQVLLIGFFMFELVVAQLALYRLRTANVVKRIKLPEYRLESIMINDPVPYVHADLVDMVQTEINHLEFKLVARTEEVIEQVSVTQSVSRKEKRVLKDQHKKSRERGAKDEATHVRTDTDGVVTNVIVDSNGINHEVSGKVETNESLETVDEIPHTQATISNKHTGVGQYRVDRISEECIEIRRKLQLLRKVLDRSDDATVQSSIFSDHTDMWLTKDSNGLLSQLPEGVAHMVVCRWLNMDIREEVGVIDHSFLRQCVNLILKPTTTLFGLDTEGLRYKTYVLPRVYARLVREHALALNSVALGKQVDLISLRHLEGWISHYSPRHVDSVGEILKNLHVERPSSF
jgi:hypothetical protein